MPTVGNIGIGLFVLIILWIVSLSVFVYFIREQSSIGWFTVITATLVTVILISIPLQPKQLVEEIEVSVTSTNRLFPRTCYVNVCNFQEKDYNLLYRRLVLGFLSICSILACVAFFFLHCVESVRPKPIKTF